MRRIDILFIAIGVGLLALVVWAGVAVAGEPGRIFLCKYHLCELSDSFEQYAKDNSGAIPAAVLDAGTNSVIWDAAIAPYLVSASARQDKDLHQHVAKWFACPSDTEPRGGQGTRSYSMPMYDVNKAGWPPDENSIGGLGLYLDVKALKKARDISEDANLIPAIKISMVPTPADTALLVERISILNALWQPKYACIISTREQFDAKTIDRRIFHGGKMNYLMLDGHVELLSPVQSCGFAGTGGGTWTIQAGD